MLHMEYVSLWKRGLDVNSNREGKSGSIRNVVLPKNDEIKWIDRESNERVLRRVGEKKSLLKTLSRRRENLVGHIMRHDGLMKTIVEGQVEGKKGKGRPRISYIGQVIKDVKEKNYVAMKRLADRKEEWIAVSSQS